VFVSSNPKGSPHGHFQRAVARRQALPALAAARELGWLNLGDALALCLLLADEQHASFEPAAVRWLGRYLLELKGVRLPEAQLVLSAFSTLSGPAGDIGAEALIELGRARGMVGLESAVRPLLDRP